MKTLELKLEDTIVTEEQMDFINEIVIRVNSINKEINLKRSRLETLRISLTHWKDGDTFIFGFSGSHMWIINNLGSRIALVS